MCIFLGSLFIVHFCIDGTIVGVEFKYLLCSLWNFASLNDMSMPGDYETLWQLAVLSGANDGRRSFVAVSPRSQTLRFCFVSQLVMIEIRNAKLFL